MSELFPKLQDTFTADQVKAIADSISSQETAPESYILADCVSVTVKDNKVCLELPLDLGKKCIDLPDWVPNGEAARACVSVKRKWRVPVGVNLCVYVAGEEVACAYYGI
ncbi:hypothetical protein [Leptolyngbya sp. FACHB-261]|uniref:hypothetical protein n=1 Tax=Leptolyngbya sp. FACHB-261 TaxID=2692806 RepID=UPI001688263C|nr:hypothetical protein [Leptolyngbya sp. FACHB-261]MBD2099306.1 hypothetical protein [Leptolyngbya sp. FACHB-261]